MARLRQKWALGLSLAVALLAWLSGQAHATADTVTPLARGHHTVTQGQQGSAGAGGSGKLWDELVRRGNSRRLQAPIDGEWAPTWVPQVLGALI